ncbi:MAG: hypothetical protein V3W37_04810 [Candidatus Binatia bacterium]
MRAAVLTQGRGAAQPNLLAEEVGVAWLFLAEFEAIAPRLARRLDCVEDAAVARAPAKVAGQSLGNRLAITGSALLKHGGCPYDDARNAIAALDRPVLHESLSQHPALLLRDALKRDYLTALLLLRLPKAGEHWLAIYQDCAAAAVSLRCASVFGRGDAAFVSQNFKEVHPGLIGHRRLFSVEGE